MSKARVTELRYVGLALPEFDNERKFCAELWGLKEVALEGDLAYFAAEGSPHQYVLRLRRNNDRRMDLCGFAAATRADVDALHQQVIAAGAKIISAPAPLTSPGGGYGFRFFDPDGRTLEISSDVAERPFRQLAKNEAIPTGLSHVVFHSPTHKETTKFYEEALGFRVSDWLSEFMVFLRCNQWHHRLAFLPGPAGLNHVAFDVSEVDDLMRGIGRMVQNDIHLQWGPGRHTAGNNTFSYFTTPGGNVFEYTSDLEEVDDDNWEATTYAMAPEITDQWGTGRLTGGGGHQRPDPDPALWQAPPV
jgi:catechol 2,3-dioxygenase-like lactoylglutathione lyase family enzyme